MKKSTLFSILLIAFGFLFEYLHYAVDNVLFDVKFFILGIVCVIAGVLGLWLFTILPALGEKKKNK